MTECISFTPINNKIMSSSSSDEDSQSKNVLNFFPLPKFSWETETLCDEFTQNIPTYSWEYDTQSPIYATDGSTSTIVPDSQFLQNIHHNPKYLGETETHLIVDDKHPEGHDQNRVVDDVLYREIEDVQPSLLIEKSDTYGGSPASDFEFAQRPESPNLNLDVDAIKRECCDGFSDTYGGSSSYESKDQNYGDEFAQRPESPNLNLDVDAIKRECCDGFLNSPPKKQKGKKSFW